MHENIEKESSNLTITLKNNISVAYDNLGLSQNIGSFLLSQEK